MRFGRSAKGLSTEDIIEEISTSPRNKEVPEITSANRATIQKYGSKIPTGTFFLTFNSECLSTYLFLRGEHFTVERYLPTPAGALNAISSDMAQRHAAQKKIYAQSARPLNVATKTAPNRTHHIASTVPDPTKPQTMDAQNIYH